MSTGIGCGISSVFETRVGTTIPAFSNLYSIRFDGLTQELNNTSGAIPILGVAGLGDWTVSFWFRAVTIASGVNQRIIFLDGTGANITWYFTAIGLLQGGMIWSDSCSFLFSDNTWYNVVYVADRSNSLGAAQAKGYYWVNGVFSDAKNIASYAGTAFPTTGNEVIIGTNPSSAQYYAGEVDEISIWDRTLSDIEVVDLYNGGTPTNLTGQADLTHWWRMGDPLGQASYPTISDLGSAPINLTMINMLATNIVTDVP